MFNSGRIRAASPATQRDLPSCSAWAFLAIDLLPRKQETAHAAQSGRRYKRDRREPKLAAPERHYCFAHETQSRASYRVGNSIALSTLAAATCSRPRS
jgi:hypothetical protein